jgi:hypothetical protein
MNTYHIHNTGPAKLAGRIPKGAEQHFQSAPLAEAEWKRLPHPKGGRCEISGLSRSALIDLGVIVPGLIVRLRRPGAVRGAALLHVPTLREYLREVRAKQLTGGAP